MNIDLKILFSTPGFSGFGVDYPSTLATELQNKGHDVTGLCFANYPQIDAIDIKTKWTLRSIDRYIYTDITDRHPWVTGYGRWAFNWILYHRWKGVVRKELEGNDYDIVVTTRIAIAPTVIAANKQEVPSVVITTGPATVKYNPNETAMDKSPRFTEYPIKKKIQFPFIKAVHRWNDTGFNIASEVVAMSEFDASITRETFGRDPTILHIPVPLEEFETDTDSASNITLVNPRDSHKGLDTFLQIARRLPDESFLIAGSLYDNSLEPTIRDLDNVTHLGWCDDMREVYANTKLLTIPSTYQEGGNRVIPEAFVNGIPVVGSDLGGIPDYIGDGGITVENYTDADAWITAIRQLLDDGEQYEEYSQRARERAELFALEDCVDEFEATLRAVAEDR